ncbi:MAG TPA: SDR family NAD(P)-dependent oxidoreductase [Polyangiaceae bacterium]|jgi:NAD(P)-dependent dehydrogenase (short-subunit alcohol dehydrogenase family)|nr:SDR family NAD(P)-dependent oxidoreductase [Polyangiaceae bacterium]
MRAAPHKTDSVVLVTGATDGIGKETALELARLGARVIIHGRSEARVAAAHEELRSVSEGPPPPPVIADFTSLSEVRALGLELSRRGLPIDTLINNAGVYMKRRELSAEGIELTLAVNHFAHVLLTHLLLESQVGQALTRIVNVSSIAHARAHIDLEDIENARGAFDDYQAYATSKFANVLFTVELARRLEARGVKVNALHPGVVSTKLLETGFDMRGPDSLGKGARSSVMLAISPEYGHISGAYFVEGRESHMHRRASDAELAARYYELSAARVGVKPLARV